MLAVLFMICDSTPTTLTSRQSAWSPSSAATLAAVVLLGPGGAALVGATSLISLRRGGLRERAFNGAMYALSAYAAGVAYLALGGHIGVPMAGSFPDIILPFAVAAAVHVAVNHGLLWTMLLLLPPSGASPQRGRLDLHLSLLLVSDLGYATLGLLIAALWASGRPVRRGAGADAAVRGALGDGAVRRAAARLRRPRWPRCARRWRPRTSTPAATASGCRAAPRMIARRDRDGRGAGRGDPLRGHAARRRQARRARPRCCRRTGPLTEEEFAAIQLHPMRGLEIVRRDRLPRRGARRDHAPPRADGRQGLPDGAGGRRDPRVRPGHRGRRRVRLDDLHPLLPRRPDASRRRVAELRKCAGTQFDPMLVDAFIAALERERLGAAAAPASRRPRPTADRRPGRDPGPRRPDRTAAGRREPREAPAVTT